MTIQEIIEKLKQDPNWTPSAEDNVSEEDLNTARSELAEEAKAEEAEAEKLAEKQVELVEKMVEKKVAEKLASMDKPVHKNINMGANPANPKDMSKEEKFKRYVMAIKAGDMSLAREIVGKDAMNTSDQSAVVPPAEFIAEVMRLQEDYGVAIRYADVRRVSKSSLEGFKGTNGVTIYRTDELGVKQSTKLDYTRFTLSFIKFAGILPMSDELEEESAVNLWNDAVNEFARAFAQEQDKLVFTDATSGILNLAGVNSVTVGDNFEDLTFDHLNQGMYKVPSASMANGRFYFHRELLGVIQRIKDQNDNYIWRPGPNGPEEGTIWGKPYTLVEVMPNLSDDDGTYTPFMIFGDLKKTILGIRNSLDIMIANQAVVLDPDDAEATINLFTQDAKAMRAVQKFNAKTVFENAYTVFKTGEPAS